MECRTRRPRATANGAADNGGSVEGLVGAVQDSADEAVFEVWVATDHLPVLSLNAAVSPLRWRLVEHGEHGAGFGTDQPTAGKLQILQQHLDAELIVVVDVGGGIRRRFEKDGDAAAKVGERRLPGLFAGGVV